MSVATKLKSFLDAKHVPYEIVPHAETMTAIETAEAENALADQMLKVVMLRIDGQEKMFVIPADRMIDRKKLKKEFRTQDIHVAEEREFMQYFPDSETGAMPPFGNLYHIPCYVDFEVENQREVFFNAGTHQESIKLPVAAYLRLAGAEIGDYSKPKNRIRFDF